MSPFAYETLPDSRKYLRLLKLLPIEDRNNSLPDSETICCELTCVPLSEKPVYQALSYAWGSETDLRYINVNGFNFPVTQNLYWFLYRHSRTQNEHRNIPLWIDAACINQSDDAEKSHQVQMMGRTDENAQHVITW
ncbi:hypothetical protein BU16DRAFT_462344, partial [Lophium mytilinum]